MYDAICTSQKTTYKTILDLSYILQFRFFKFTSITDISVSSLLFFDFCKMYLVVIYHIKTDTHTVVSHNKFYCFEFSLFKIITLNSFYFSYF